MLGTFLTVQRDIPAIINVSNQVDNWIGFYDIGIFTLKLLIAITLINIIFRNHWTKERFMNIVSDKLKGKGDFSHIAKRRM